MSNDSKKERLSNIVLTQQAIGLLGNVGGIIYANKTGGGFWRYVGYSLLGGLIVGIPTMLVANHFKNKILKEPDTNTNSESNKSDNTGDKKSVSKEQEEMSTPSERRSILAEAINLENRIKKVNWISKYKGDGLNDWTKKWSVAKPTMKEYNALYKFLNSYTNCIYCKSDTETLKLLSDEEKKLVSGVSNRLMKA